MKAFTGVLIAALSLGVVHAQAEELGAATPFKVGSLELVSLKDTQFVMPNNGSVFGVGLDPKLVAEALKTAGAPTDTVTLNVDSLLVKDSGRVILIDTGIGAGGKGQLVDSLKKVGLTPADITDVLITHAHGDHIGGLLAADGQPAFPNATVRLSTPEWESVKAGAKMAALVKAIEAKVKTFEPGSQISPAIKAVPIAGHTPGHTGYEITSGQAKLLDIGDAAHSSIISLMHPEWVIQFDGDKPLATASRKALLTKLAKDHSFVFSPHFPYPGIGTIKAKGEGFEWVPAKP